MCNLYNITTTRDAVIAFTKAFRDKAGWNQPSYDPGYQAPVVRVDEDGEREIARVTWGMPSPPMLRSGCCAARAEEREFRSTCQS